MSFSGLVDRSALKLALLLNAVSPLVGGALIRGPHGTGKTTAVRALANVLPRQEGVADCPYFCSPYDSAWQCERCRERLAAGPVPIENRPVRVVEVPLNITEDRLIGSIDLERTLATGHLHAQLGLLADANRNMLYIDDVNLLNDAAVDVLLDAAALGVNYVEREGISLAHPSRFTLIGTMNPAEGELRPQLLDRFGLCVDVETMTEVDARLAVLLREPESSPADDADLAARIEAARERFGTVTISKDMRRRIAHLAGTRLAVDGHRADLVLTAAARALAAFEGKPRVSEAHIHSVAPLALVHRVPELSFKEAYEAVAEATEAEFSSPASQATRTVHTEAVEAATGEQIAPSGASEDSGARILQGGEPFTLRRLIKLPSDRVARSAAGRRVSSITRRPSGRYTRAIQQQPVTDLALDATVRAAAPFQIERGREPGERLELRKSDLRQKRRQRKTRALLILVVDTSDSMGSRDLQVAMRRALLAFLQDAYEKRDRVALIEFSFETARVILPPTGNYTRARAIVDQVTLGGTTPLAAGMLRALEIVERERRRDASVYPLLVLITDGQANVNLFGQYQGNSPFDDALRLARGIREEHIPAIVVDTGPNYSARQAPWAADRCRAVAQEMGANYYVLSRLMSNSLVDAPPDTTSVPSVRWG